jgi:hypothetical protein
MAVTESTRSSVVPTGPPARRTATATAGRLPGAYSTITRVYATGPDATAAAGSRAAAGIAVTAAVEIAIAAATVGRPGPSC